MILFNENEPIITFKINTILNNYKPFQTFNYVSEKEITVGLKGKGST